MEDNKLMIFKKPELTPNDDISGVIVQKSKRRHKRKGFKRFVIFVLLASVIGAGVYFRDKIKEFITEIIPKNVTQETDDTTQNDELKNEENDAEKSPPNTSELNIVEITPNQTKFSNESSLKEDFSKLNYSLPSANDIYSGFSATSPVVLIVCFSPNEAYFNESSDEFHKSSENVTEIGRYICSILNSHGVNAHFLATNDGGDAIISSKENYDSLIKDFLSAHPSTGYIFDISRDIEITNDSAYSKESVVIDGYKYPTIHFTSGTGGDTATESQLMSIFLACQLLNKINESYPLLVSEQTVSRYSLSQCFNVPALRVDIGSYPCSFEEAKKSAELFAISLAQYLS